MPAPRIGKARRESFEACGGLIAEMVASDSRRVGRESHESCANR
jgi:hypothetical protein